MRKVMMWLAVMVLAGCTQTRYISVPEYRTQYVARADSVWLHDSVTVKDSVLLYVRGDTVYREKYVDRLVYRDRQQVRTDTVVVRDSICVAVPVEAAGTAWGRFKDKVLIVVCVAAVLAVGGLLLRLWWRRA